jgi:hypothetical protein
MKASKNSKGPVGRVLISCRESPKESVYMCHHATKL